MIFSWELLRWMSYARALARQASRRKLLDDLPVHVGQAVIAALVAAGEPGVVEPQQVQDCGLMSAATGQSISLQRVARLSRISSPAFVPWKPQPQSKRVWVLLSVEDRLMLRAALLLPPNSYNPPT